MKGTGSDNMNKRSYSLWGSLKKQLTKGGGGREAWRGKSYRRKRVEFQLMNGGGEECI